MTRQRKSRPGARRQMGNDREDIARLNRRTLLAGGSLIAVVGGASASVAHAVEGENAAAVHHVSPADLKEMETWIYSLALQAATYAAPIVAMYLLRDSVSTGAGSKAPPGQIWKMSDISTPKLSQEA